MTSSDQNSGAEGPVPMTPQEVGQGRKLWPRILWMAVIALMISLAQTLLFAIALVQVLIMALSRGEPNERLAEAGAVIGGWVAKAARFNAV
ncbi:MAG: DUF4389 domain-containing protein, partial [Nocardiopsis sp. BM-2018]